MVCKIGKNRQVTVLSETASETIVGTVVEKTQPLTEV